MSNQAPADFEAYKPQSAKDKLLVASKQNPAMPAGIAIGSAVLAYMMYTLKTSKEKLSVHLIHTRIGVQSSVVVSLTGVLFYQFYK